MVFSTTKNKTMKYFAKYFPVEGEIKKGEKVYWTDPDDGHSSGIYTVVETPTDDITLILSEYSEAEVLHHEIQPVKLFLCSRDIQVGDEITHLGGLKETINSEEYLQKCQILFKTGEAFKVIGEISPDAIWVKEGDEFDDKDLYPIPYSYNEWYEKFDKQDRGRFESHASINRYNQVPNGWKAYKVKGPCGHFH